jgi:hypothetical protein
LFVWSRAGDRDRELAEAIGHGRPTFVSTCLLVATPVWFRYDPVHQTYDTAP